MTGQIHKKQNFTIVNVRRLMSADKNECVERVWSIFLNKRRYHQGEYYQLYKGDCFVENSDVEREEEEEEIEQIK